MTQQTGALIWETENNAWIKGLDYFVFDPTTGNRAKFWYDFSLKLWTSYAIDKVGWQVGSVVYSNTKAEAKRSVLDLVREDSWHRNDTL
jgi:hypothetical protein